MISEVESAFPNASLHYSLSILKEKVHQVESVITLFISQDQTHYDSSSLPISTINSLIQEIVFTASSMLVTFQQTPPSGSNPRNMIDPDEFPHHLRFSSHRTSEGSYGQEFNPSETTSIDWYVLESLNNGGTSNSCQNFEKKKEENQNRSPKHYDIIELQAAELLAKYTHCCQVCGKGFKRHANLRMHMRAHGDEYKTSAALSNPMKNDESWKKREDFPGKLPRKYSCPQEGCRWNRKHAKFQPLKSMICVKNHYKRSHCPKMYICKRCNQKQFSVLSDLKTHEKHCGDLKWQCSCGTTFSRKDKLMGHVALFVGHSPLMSSVMKQRKSARQTVDYS